MIKYFLLAKKDKVVNMTLALVLRVVSNKHLRIKLLVKGSGGYKAIGANNSDCEFDSLLAPHFGRIFKVVLFLI